MFPRLAHNHAQNGYYPTDDQTLIHCVKMLDINGDNLRIFDPCCGGGHALSFLQKHLSECGARVSSFGIELSGDRATEARSLLNHAIQADIENCIVQTRAVGLLFLNPPYGLMNKDSLSTERSKRLEELFFDRTISSLQDNGILVLIVPKQSLTPKFTLDIASRFLDVKLFQASVETYNQMVIFGIKPRNRHSISKKVILAQQEVLLNYEEAMLLSDLVDQSVYYIPEQPLKVFKPISFKLELGQMTRETNNNQAQLLWPVFNQVFSLAGLKDKRRPLMPLGEWHTALALAAGQVQGLVTAPSGRTLLVKGNTYKIKVITQDIDDENHTVTSTVTDKFIPSIKAIDLTIGSRSYGDVLTIK